jgi:hypothetical protein
MSDELKKKVARLFCDTAAGQCGDDFFCEQCLGGADEAIGLIRADALEEAARVVSRMPSPSSEWMAEELLRALGGFANPVPAAIRAMKDGN